MININKIKFLVPAVYELSGFGGEFLDADWAVDYNLDLDDEFQTELAHLLMEIELLDAASRQRDMVAAMFAMVMVRGYALNLYGFFANIYDDMESVSAIGGEEALVSQKDFCVSESCDKRDFLYFDMLGLDKIKSLIPLLYSFSEPGRGFDTSEWRIDFSSNLDGTLQREIADFQVGIDWLHDAISRNDLGTALFASKRVRASAWDLSEFFKRIFDDVERVGWPDDKPLADIPEDYELPAHYNYPARLH